MNASPDNRKRVILMADDDEDDRLLTAEALKRCGLEGEISFFADGAELMDFLRGDTRGAPAVGGRPEIILLDINMPKKNGWDVLDELKSDSRLSPIPVILMTTSSSEQDVVRSYRMGASSFITKPRHFQDLVRVVGEIGEYWFKTVRLPDHVHG